ncbi:MAG TPA: MOP flippase family protein [Bacteroidetes bacterium]|nr:MOP flippase family protein [Bacteroidota bacterium]
MASLKRKALVGVAWTGLAKFSVQGLQFLLTIILARLLVPDDFGVIGMASVVTTAIAMVNERGLTAALVQRPDLEERHLSSSFWASLVFGGFLFLAVVVAAPFVAGFFHKPVVRPVLIVMALGFIIGAFGLVQKALLTRHLDFRKLALLEIVSVTSSGVVSVVLAFLGFGVWSLVWGSVLTQLVQTILLWLFVSWKPRLLFDWQAFKGLLTFGANVLGTNVAVYVNTNVDYVVVGRTLGSEPLGYYTIAFNMVTLPVYRLAGIVSKVAFPTFSRVQHDLARFRQGYLEAIHYISMAIFPLLTGLMIFAPEFVQVVLGPKWMPATVPIQVLSIMALLKSVGTTKGAVLLARGRADIELKWNLAYLGPFVAALIVGTHWGLVGVAVAYVVVYTLAFPIIQGITNRTISLPWRDFFRALVTPFEASLGLAAVSLLWKFWIGPVLATGAVPLLIGGALLGGSAYVLLLLRLEKGLLQHVRQLVSQKETPSEETALSEAEALP